MGCRLGRRTAHSRYGADYGKKEWLVRFVGKHACTKMRKCLGKPPALTGQAKLSVVI